MFPLIWDYIAWKIDIKEDIYGRSVRKKEQKKIRYDGESRRSILTQIKSCFLKI